MVQQSPPLVALVTGASRGIGRGIAQTLAERGARLALHYHQDRASAEATLAALPGSGHALFRADMASATEVGSLWRDVTQHLGVPEVVVNNAGVYFHHPPLENDQAGWQAAWQRTVATNLLGPAALCHLAARAMAARPEPRSPAFGRGRIVNISSRGAFRGEPEAPAYGASKAGLNSLGQSLARALGPHAVYVYCIAPGWVATDMAAAHLAGDDGPAIRAQHPLGRVVQVEEVAGAAVYCALDAPASMTGAILDVNGASYLRS